MPAREAVTSVKRGHYPDAVAVFLYGSMLAGTATAVSDVDLFFVTPPGDDMHERRFDKQGVRVQATAVPVNALPHLPEISRKAKRPVGLIGLAHGQLIDGDLPELDRLQDTCRSVLVKINDLLRDKTEANLRIAIDTAESAAAANGPGGLALALRAVPMLLEVELQRAADDHNASRSQYRRLAERHPKIVTDYAVISNDILAGNLTTLRDKAEALKSLLPPEPAVSVRRNLSLKRLLGPQLGGARRSGPV